MSLDPALAVEPYCYVTTTGRVTGNPHTVEIWFGHIEASPAVEADAPATIYILAGSGERADWVRNARKQPEVQVRIAERRFAGRVRIVEDASEDAASRRLLLEKYQPGYGSDLGDWSRRSLPVAIEPTPEA